jgi:hypothetical protein
VEEEVGLPRRNAPAGVLKLLVGVYAGEYADCCRVGVLGKDGSLDMLLLELPPPTKFPNSKLLPLLKTLLLKLLLKLFVLGAPPFRTILPRALFVLRLMPLPDCRRRGLESYKGFPVSLPSAWSKSTKDCGIGIGIVEEVHVGLECDIKFG